MFAFDCLALALTPDSSGALLHNILLLHNNTPYCLFPSSIFNSVSSDVRAAQDVDTSIVYSILYIYNKSKSVCK